IPPPSTPTLLPYTTLFRSVGLDPEDTVRDFLTQFPHDSVTAGSPHVPQEDHEAIESDRQSAQTALKLISVAVPLAIVILYLTLRSEEHTSELQSRSDLVCR